MKSQELHCLTVGPERTCLGCGSRFAKGKLLRFVVRAGILVVDLVGGLPGRGVYCCNQAGCLKKFVVRKGRLSKMLRQEVTDCQVVSAISAGEFGGKSDRV